MKKKYLLASILAITTFSQVVVATLAFATTSGPATYPISYPITYPNPTPTASPKPSMTPIPTATPSASPTATPSATPIPVSGFTVSGHVSYVYQVRLRMYYWKKPYYMYRYYTFTVPAIGVSIQARNNANGSITTVKTALLGNYSLRLPKNIYTVRAFDTKNTSFIPKSNLVVLNQNRSLSFFAFLRFW